jgi:protein TonB
MKFERTIPNYDVGSRIPDAPVEVSIENFKVYVEPKKEIQPEKKKKVLLTNKIREVDNDFELKKALDIITIDQNTTSDPPIDPSKIKVIDNPDNDAPISIIAVQKVPVYPGCEKAKDNKERKKCMSEKISKLIQRKFDGNEIASDYGLTGRQKIDVQFTIDKTGRVTNIKTRSPHPKLDKEAVRVINFIPEMTPGKQNNKNVGVIYNLPIIFQVQ